MVRGARKQSESGIYHVVSRGVGRCVIFEDDTDRVRFLEKLVKVFAEHDIELHAWCLMSNHFHLLVRSDLDRLAMAMKHLNSTYALYFNKRYGRVGHLFQGRFKSEPVGEDRYYLTVLRYIHQNPQKAGICSADEYRWSSYREYVGESGPSSTDLGLAMLGGPDAFREFHAVCDDAAVCLDIGGGRKVIDDDDAMRVAKAALPGLQVENVASLSKGDRDEALRTLRRARLSIRQIERLTGISRNIVAKAK